MRFLRGTGVPTTAQVIDVGGGSFELVESETGILHAPLGTDQQSVDCCCRKATERHWHVHSHEPLFHAHAHIHDEHHDAGHEHGPDDPPPSDPLPHAHRHQHDPLVHTHAHYPDLHHRHGN